MCMYVHAHAMVAHTESEDNFVKAILSYHMGSGDGTWATDLVGRKLLHILSHLAVLFGVLRQEFI